MNQDNPYIEHRLRGGDPTALPIVMLVLLLVLLAFFKS